LNLLQQNRELNSQLAVIATAAPPTAIDRGERNGGLRQALDAELEANAKLRQELARLKGEPPPPKITSAPAPVLNTAPNRPNRGGGGPDGWLDRIQQQDPERYQQIISEREQRRKEAQDWYDNTLAQLQTRAQAPASPDEATLVTQISDTLAKLNDLRQQMQAARQLPDDQRQAQIAQLMPAMQAAWQDLSKLREQDRALQYAQLGKQLGLSDDKAQALATSIPTIHLNTQYMPRGGGGASVGGGQSAGGTQPNTPSR
jgi:uncharacterized phage infection (PIP) family protein YhgE